LKAISLDVRPDRTLLVCCKAFNARPEDFENLTVKKIPHAVLSRCEWGRDDYSLEVSNLPIVERALDTLQHVATNEGAKGKRKANDDQPTLFGVGEE
jgi:adenine-specific DNA-methyltransferase